jgi:hypothetical protein
VTKAKLVVVPQCEVGLCGDDDGQAQRAEYVVPRTADGWSPESPQWEFVLVCEYHARGWWDGSDVPAWLRPQAYGLYEHDLDLPD